MGLKAHPTNLPLRTYLPYPTPIPRTDTEVLTDGDSEHCLRADWGITINSTSVAKLHVQAVPPHEQDLTLSPTKLQ